VSDPITSSQNEFDNVPGLELSLWVLAESGQDESCTGGDCWTGWAEMDVDWVSSRDYVDEIPGVLISNPDLSAGAWHRIGLNMNHAIARNRRNGWIGALPDEFCSRWQRKWIMVFVKDLKLDGEWYARGEPDVGCRPRVDELNSGDPWRLGRSIPTGEHQEQGRARHRTTRVHRGSDWTKGKAVDQGISNSITRKMAWQERNLLHVFCDARPFAIPTPYPNCVAVA
jgi:hypothetical protein